MWIETNQYVASGRVLIPMQLEWINPIKSVTYMYEIQIVDVTIL